MSKLLFAARDLSDTDRLGSALAQVLPASSVISLIGHAWSGEDLSCTGIGFSIRCCA